MTRDDAIREMMFAKRNVIDDSFIRPAVFEYDENGIGKITLECMDVLMGMIPQWIPCSERLPKEDENVLVTVHFHGSKKPPTKGSYYVEVANQLDGEWCSYSDEYKVAKDRHEVIAWMPLPSPYTEEEQ